MILTNEIVTWQDIFNKNKKLLDKINILLVNEKNKGKIIFPDKKDIFKAFLLTEFKDIKIVILGQDPYHNYNQANGLAFSVQENIKIPPSLKNIYKEIEQSLKVDLSLRNGNLEHWAKNGIFLLNNTLSVEAHKANSHQKLIPWQEFTDNIIQEINKYHKNIVFILWGKNAKNKGKIIDREKNLVLESVHPSPLSAHKGFFGNNHFKIANLYLQKYYKNFNLKEII